MKLLPELPLLRRELTELANRKRTYVIRVLGAVGILFYVFIMYEKAMNARLGQSLQLGINPMLGVGGDIFGRVTPTLFMIIQALMPALCCAAIAYEKESNTIGTLLLTKLSPLTIIIEKFLSRIIPMLTILLLSFPILAHVFSLGGVDTSTLLVTVWLLLCECLLLGSVALLCSAWFPTTVSAFTASYIATALMLILIYPLQLQTWIPSGIWHSFFGAGYGYGINIRSIDDLTFISRALAQTGFSQSTYVAVFMIERTIPDVLLTMTFLLISRFLLIRRAFTSQSSVLLKMFRVVDRFFQWLNERTTGGIQLTKDGISYPIDAPVAWRERSKKSLGKARYLFRILVLLQVPTLFICGVAATNSAYRQFDGLYVLLAILWVLAALIVCMKAATLMVSERAHQTLESLLACPMTAREIFLQKINGMRRLTIVMAVPVLTVHLTLFLVQADFGSIGAGLIRDLLYLGMAFYNTFLFLSFITWLSAGIGLKFHSQIKAVLTAAIAVTTWALGPLLLDSVISVFWQEDIAVLATLSPISAIGANEAAIRGVTGADFGLGREALEWDPVSVSIILTLAHTLVLFVLRTIVLNRLPSLFGRKEGGDAIQHPVSPRQPEGATL